jgi:hypothetical protein
MSRSVVAVAVLLTVITIGEFSYNRGNTHRMHYARVDCQCLLLDATHVPEGLALAVIRKAPDGTEETFARYPLRMAAAGESEEAAGATGACQYSIELYLARGFSYGTLAAACRDTRDLFGIDARRARKLWHPEQYVVRPVADTAIVSDPPEVRFASNKWDSAVFRIKGE